MTVNRHPVLPDSPSLRDVQDYVRQIKDLRGFTNTDPVPDCVLLGEEVGELFKAVRKARKGSMVDENSTAGDSVAEEIADVLIVLSGIANIYGIDMEQALRAKEEKNKTRVWKIVS
ncbi:MAG: pyrophosphohydrolase [Proteobacteria bacterium]|nr:pyrophosphohydrolase [Pseudomonadota bacterium]